MAKVSLEEFTDKLLAVFPMMMKNMLSREKAFLESVTLVQFGVMHLLFDAGPSKMSSLAKILNVSMATTTGIVSRLVRMKYVMRLSDPNDRRIIKIGLTKKGFSLVEKVHAEKRATIISIFSKISPEDRATYLRILTNIRDILAKE